MAMGHDDIAALQATVRPLLMVMPRLLPMMLVMPAFSPQIMTSLARNGLIVVLAAFTAPLIDYSTMATVPYSMWIVLCAKEALIGLLLGFAFSAMLWAIENVGHLIDFQTGSGNFAFFDPVSGDQSGPTAVFLNLLACTLFVTGGGLHAMLGMFLQSYKLWPVASLLPNAHQVLDQFAMRATDSVMQASVKLAAPVIIVLVLVELGLSLIARSVPQLNVFMISQPVKGLIAVLMMALFLYFVYGSLHAFLAPDGPLFAMLRATL
ncbi:type III secretion system export apparatus subunit SctT [Paraburkholderia phosphatilytica]|uniref:type III secretion system export apparatus subunit SctT n=1 Tax=Paraburkholderia phosphatilytica TaxID=2282883 RepID=UPI000E490E99|nr:type III secretion system export apparatus subunit SctT [Paraburkholderia phosphatilytica]